MFETSKKESYQEEKAPPSGYLSGNSHALLAILNQRETQTVKVEGKKMEWGKQSHTYDIIELKEGKLVRHINCAPIDMQDYDETKATVVLRLDNVDVALVIKQLISTKGIYKKKERESC